MEQRLAADNPVDWSPTPGVPPAGPELITKDKEIVITRLESQVEEQVGTIHRCWCVFTHLALVAFSQRLLRLQDAKQVEAKAAKIKEWVTNKLREVSHQLLKKISQILVPVFCTYRDLTKYTLAFLCHRLIVQYFGTVKPNY
jgi:hypothetical protein